MNAQTILDYNKLFRTSQHQIFLQRNTHSEVIKENSTVSFVPDFTSPADEIQKIQPAKAEAQSSPKKNQPFSYTSENWVG